MKRVIAWIMAVFLLVGSVSLFADTEEISGQKLKEKGIVTGGSNGDLMPDKVLTRVEMAVLLSRLYGEEKLARGFSRPSGFVDENEIPEWGKNYVTYARMRAWLEGDRTTGKFYPNGSITGEQLAAILLRILGYPNAEWGKNRNELYTKTGVEIKVEGEIKRGQVFEALWKAISEPVMSDGESTFLDLIELGKKHLEKDEAEGKTVHYIWHNDNIREPGFFSDGMQRVEYLEDGIWRIGYANEKGELAVKMDLGTFLINPRVFGNDRFSEGRAMIITRNGAGFIDKTGKVIVQPQYYEAAYYREGLAWVLSEQGWSYIDLNGRVVIDQGILGQGKNITAGGEGVIPPPMKDYHFRDGLAYFGDGQRYGLMNKKGEVVIPISDRYHRLNRFSDGLALVINEQVDNLKFGYIDKTGKIVVDIKYADAHDFREGLASVNIGTLSAPKWGFIDKTGKLVIPALYAYAYDFHEGLAVVTVPDGKGGQKYGFIDKSGKYVVEPIYREALNFREGFASVNLNGKYGIIDKTGKLVVEHKYDFIHEVHNGVAVVSLNGRNGVIDTEGREIVEIKYTGIYGPINDNEKCYTIEDGKRTGFFYFED
ncbi:MAG: WG repeat-containing protein [Bacillota bacterium]|nr:WG repeat-containing protein [Bacillota bacterium]